MLNIAVEIPDNLDLTILLEQIKYLEVEIAEMPGTNPRIITAVATDPETFYRLGGVIAVQLMTLHNI